MERLETMGLAKDGLKMNYDLGQDEVDLIEMGKYFAIR